MSGSEVQVVRDCELGALGVPVRLWAVPTQSRDNDIPPGLGPRRASKVPPGAPGQSPEQEGPSLAII